MTDSIGESITMAKTFRFASGQILSLDEDQIEKVPYLAVMVSSADNFESGRDEDGHYKLDPNIEYKHFSFVLESLSFHSVRQLFTCLPKQHDIIPIIAHLDFLGIGPQPDPTLNDVDSTFFSNLVYSPLLEEYLQIIRPSIIQDMAVRFAITMAKEEYDFTKPKIIDQIYWFIMFILSAPKLFGPRFRHHVYKIAEHCFSLFKPSLLKSFKKLKQRIHDENFDSNEVNECPWEQILNLCDSNEFYFFKSMRTLKQRQELLLHQKYSYESNYSSFRYKHTFNEEKYLEAIYKRVLEIMYERLQSEICQCAVAEIRKKKNPHNLVRKETPLWFIFPELEFLPDEIDDIIKRELVQKEIRERILEEINVLIPKLEEKRAELVKKIQNYDQNQETPSVWLSIYWYLPSSYRSNFEIMQEEALCCELTLNKLTQDSSIVEHIRRRVLGELHSVAQRQFGQWKRTQKDIDELHDNLSSYQQLEILSSITSKITHKSHRIPVNKPLPKLQQKYSMRKINYFK